MLWRGKGGRPYLAQGTDLGKHLGGSITSRKSLLYLRGGGEDSSSSGGEGEVRTTPRKKMEIEGARVQKSLKKLDVPSIRPLETEVLFGPGSGGGTEEEELNPHRAEGKKEKGVLCTFVSPKGRAIKTRRKKRHYQIFLVCGEGGGLSRIGRNC